MKNADRYRCPECGNTTTVFVRVIEPPTCSNPDRHAARTYVMEPTLKKRIK